MIIQTISGNRMNWIHKQAQYLKGWMTLSILKDLRLWRMGNCSYVDKPLTWLGLCLCLCPNDQSHNALTGCLSHWWSTQLGIALIEAGINCGSGSGLVADKGLIAEPTRHRSRADDECWEEGWTAGSLKLGLCVTRNRFHTTSEVARSGCKWLCIFQTERKLYVLGICVYVFTCLLPAPMKNVPQEPQALVYMLNLCYIQYQNHCFIQSQTAWFCIICIFIFIICTFFI